jgi:hypothetical protein
MAVAIDWLDAYRAASVSIVSLYADDATLECGCSGQKTIGGRSAISEYWRQRFVERPAGELEDLQLDGAGIVISYRVLEGVVKAVLHFDEQGRIRLSQCGPTTEAFPVRLAAVR